MRLSLLAATCLALAGAAHAAAPTRDRYQINLGVGAASIPATMGMWCDESASVAAQACMPRPPSQTFPVPATIVTNGVPVAVSPAAGTYTTPSTAARTVQTANTYQVLFAAGSLPHGLTVVNLSAVGAAPIYIDITGATGTTLSGAAIPIYPAQASGAAPGSFAWPLPIANAVTIYGPAGAVLAAAGG